MSVLDYFRATSVPVPSALAVQPASATYVQEPEKIGLLVTEELDKALEEAKKKVASIAKDCRLKNRKFRDIEFDLENDVKKCLHGVSGAEFNPSDVRHVTDIFENPRFVEDGYSSSDVVQGAISDCWFVSALATMATCAGLMEKLCVARDEQVGVYGFVFLRDMRWVSIVIDDLLFTSIPKWEELNYAEKELYHHDKDKYNASARKGSKTLYFAKSGTEGETWVPLIEKAYAKLHGDYASLGWGYASEAIEDLTGAVCSFIPSQDILDRDKFWTEELLKANKDRLFGCSTRRLDSTRSGVSNATIDGVYAGHAYSVLRAVEVKGKRFVVVRNPWGKTEWTGPWSDGSKEWTKEWLEVLPELDHTFGNDGQFVMEYKDFLACWTDIDRTILFNSTWVMSSQWLEVTTRPLPSAWSFGDVSFTISMTKPSTAVIVLSQLDTRYFSDISGRSRWSLDFALYKQGETEMLAQSVHARYFSRSVNLEIQLEAGEYVVHVRIDRQYWREKDYFEQLSENWDEQKLARVMTERAKSRSIASNFKAETEVNNIPIPLNVLAGQTLTQLEEKAKAAAAALTVVAIAEAAPTTTTTTSTTTSTTTVVVNNTPVPSAVPTNSAAGPLATGDPTTGSVDVSTTAAPAAPATDAKPTDPGDRGTIFLGLRVYTNRDAPAVLVGQLRHEMGTSFAGLSLAGNVV
ncbi:hypothetical protein FB45DRAFT_993113 [Roridomyces roridus]|uniref:Calpain catalytic domain-containing protein n=1 Tax=Roridomyces roridus TaxID=1738132 RepID=A0AAD7B7G9_9AGAR|nr:hypothetical protein FB45DRAFT_993113 [Roridomyces roridus]